MSWQQGLMRLALALLGMFVVPFYALDFTSRSDLKPPVLGIVNITLAAVLPLVSFVFLIHGLASFAYRCKRCKFWGTVHEESEDQVGTGTHTETVTRRDHHFGSDYVHVGTTEREEEIVRSHKVYFVTYRCSRCGHGWLKRNIRS